MEIRWKAVDGFADGQAAQADTPVGRVVVKKRRPGVRGCFVVWVAGKVVDRNCINMDAAMRRAEAVVNRKFTTGDF